MSLSRTRRGLVEFPGNGSSERSVCCTFPPDVMQQRTDLESNSRDPAQHRVRTKLSCRASGAPQELDEQPWSSAFKALSNVGHDRDSSASHLIAQSEIASEGSLVGQIIDRSGQFSRSLPHIQFLEPFGHPSTFNLRLSTHRPVSHTATLPPASADSARLRSPPGRDWLARLE